MFQVDVDEALRRAPRLKIATQEEGELLPFILTDEQIIVMRALAEFRRIIVLKGRQVFCSTACAFYALCFACVNPGLKIAIVADIADKARGLLKTINAWCVDGRIRMKAPTTLDIITLWNGAEIHAVTANSNDTKRGSKEAKAGRSFSYGLIVLSEFAYYARDRATLVSLIRSALKGAHVILESTATPAENEFRAIWEHGKGWHRIFLSVEQHREYQYPDEAVDDARWQQLYGEKPRIADDETWSMLQATYGFTSRAHAAYWWSMVQTDMNGDVHRALREAPILPQHAFAFAEGRWIFLHEKTEPRSFEGAAGAAWTFADGIAGGWRIYGELDESGCIMAVDTATGIGLDASAIAIIGRKKGNLIATFVARNIIITDFNAVVELAAKRWQPYATVVESNGIGEGVYQAAARVPEAHATEHSSQDPEKPIRMNVAKLAIESGQVAGGDELQYEVEHSQQKPPTKPKGAPVWEGPDDLLNAISFALVFRKRHPCRASTRKIDPRTHVDRRRFRQRKKGTKVF